MALLLKLLVYFVVGVVGDWIVARYYLHLSSGRRVKASVFSSAISYFDFIISLTLIVNQDWLSAGGFAIGTGVGTFLAMCRMKKRGEQDDL